MKNLICIFLSLLLLICVATYISYKNEYCNSGDIINYVKTTRLNTGKYRAVERSLVDISTEGASAKYYFDKDGNLVLLDLISNVSLARYSTSYYIRDGKVVFVNSVTDEWDPKKIYGEHGELSLVEAEYVLATSTREGYVVQDSVLCEYLADKPRMQSVATTASDPTKDLAALMGMYEDIKDAWKK